MKCVQSVKQNTFTTLRALGLAIICYAFRATVSGKHCWLHEAHGNVCTTYLTGDILNWTQASGCLVDCPQKRLTWDQKIIRISVRQVFLIMIKNASNTDANDFLVLCVFVVLCAIHQHRNTWSSLERRQCCHTLYTYLCSLAVLPCQIPLCSKCIATYCEYQSQSCLEKDSYIDCTSFMYASRRWGPPNQASRASRCVPLVLAALAPQSRTRRRRRHYSTTNWWALKKIHQLSHAQIN